ncbi:MAG: flagellar basal body rod protein FlgB [Granulosicoccus sp.]
MNIDNYLAVHADSLRLRSQRTKILATNIANSDTPNYKARDLAFAEVLKDVGPGLRQHHTVASRGLHMTHRDHISKRASASSASIMYREPAHASLDGNTVDKDQEQARMAENSVRYQASLQFMTSRISDLIRAIRGE